MRCFLVGKQDVDFNDVKGFKLFMRGEPPYVDGYITNSVWLPSESPLYSIVASLHFTDDKGNRRAIEADLIYDVYLGSKKPVLADIKVL